LDLSTADLNSEAKLEKVSPYHSEYLVPFCISFTGHAFPAFLWLRLILIVAPQLQLPGPRETPCRSKAELCQ